jgi:hypothetical protein
VRQRRRGFAHQFGSPHVRRHDHGSQYMSEDYQAEIAFLGMESSPSFVRPAGM